MASRITGLASPPLTPPINGDFSNNKKNRTSEMIAKPKKEKKEKKEKIRNSRLSYISTTSSVNSTATRSFMSNKRSSTVPDLQNLTIPEGLMPIGPNGERIPIMIPDGSGGLIPFIPTTKKSSNKKNKSKSSPAVNQFSDSIYKIDESKESSTNSSPTTPKPREKSKSPKKARRRQSLLIPLASSSTSPVTMLSPNLSNSGDVSMISNKNVPLFIIPTGPDGKIDPSTLPLPMSSSELMEKQKEYEESIIEESQSFMYLPRKKTSVEKLKHSSYRKNSISSVKSNLTTPGNFFKGRSEEFGIKSKKKSGKSKNKPKIDTSSLYSTESNILDGLRYRSESSPSLIKMNQNSGKKKKKKIFFIYLFYLF